MTSAAEDVLWLTLDDPSAVGAARRYVAELTERLGFPATRTAEVSIAVTELATNTVVHAVAGAMLVRVRRAGDRAAAEVLAIDDGPGVADIPAVSEDGYSSRGTLGVGLGAIDRAANRFEFVSTPGRGSVSVATFCADADVRPEPPRVDGLTRPISGEEVCGDAWSHRRYRDRLAVLVADGLGHGPMAAAASRAAVTSFLEGPWRSPAAVLADAHTALQGTRGAAVMCVEVDLAARTARYAGLGNIAGRVLGDERASTMSCQPGIVGQHAKRCREDVVSLGPGALVVLHSDGLTSKWHADALAGVPTFNPTVVAGVLLRDAGLRHDDASVVVARTEP